jgi:hypothetical protein
METPRMANGLIESLRLMKADHEKHFERLVRWKANGGKLENYPDGERLDDFLAREQFAIENVAKAIEELERRSS